MRVALLQMDMAWHDPRLNLAKAEAMIEEAADRNADIAVLPEMSMSGFSMDIEKAAEPRNGISVKGLANIAKQYKMNIIAGLSLREKGQEKACNSALIYTSDGNILGEYKKCHPFTPAGEDIRYEAGLEPVVFNLAGADSSVFICYDLRFPELMRSVAESVQVMYIIANWPAGRARHWHTLLTARAIENQCFVIGLNRTGTDGNNIGYNGESLVVGPTGMIMLRSGVAEGVELIEFDPKEALQARAEFSALRDRKF